jgi:hypothetical protein
MKDKIEKVFYRNINLYSGLRFIPLCLIFIYLNNSRLKFVIQGKRILIFRSDNGDSSSQERSGMRNDRMIILRMGCGLGAAKAGPNPQPSAKDNPVILSEV